MGKRVGFAPGTDFGNADGDGNGPQKLGENPFAGYGKQSPLEAVAAIQKAKENPNFDWNKTIVLRPRRKDLTHREAVSAATKDQGAIPAIHQQFDAAPASPRNPPPAAQFNSQHHVAPGRVGQNIANIFCQLRNLVRVAFGGMKHEMHANTIHFNRPPGKPGAAPRSVPIAGQSPQSFEHCEKFLMHGFDNNRGLFQFVGPDAVSKAGDQRMESAIAQLKHAMKESGDAGVTLGGRYHVRNVKQVSNGGSDQQCFRITADDLENPGTKRTLYVTLAGLPFDGIALKATQIERADALLARQAVLERRSGSSARGDDPMVLSYGGYGRNAALICYREAVARLDEVRSMSEVAKLLQQIVADGRRDRGPHFIHSQEQYDALYDAVCARFAKKKSKAREEATDLDDAATARRQGFAARVGSKMVGAGRRFFGMGSDT